jgi:hypothetical protein
MLQLVLMRKREISRMLVYGFLGGLKFFRPLVFFLENARNTCAG